MSSEEWVALEIGDVEYLPSLCSSRFSVSLQFSRKKLISRFYIKFLYLKDPMG